MGGMQFACTAQTETAAEAFQVVVDRAHYDHGHAGYSGTVSEKDGYEVHQIPDGMDWDQMHKKLKGFDYQSQAPTWDHPAAHLYWGDKWGPALCVPIETHEDGTRTFWFGGWASS